jgi:tetratricopeptide (TPR) repeat protein
MTRRGINSLVVLVACTICGCTAVDDDRLDNWEQVTHKGFNYFRNGQYAESSKEYKQAVEIARSLGESDWHNASSLNSLGRIYLAQADFQSAFVSFRTAYGFASKKHQTMWGLGRIFGLFGLREQECSLSVQQMEAEVESLSGMATASDHLERVDDADHFYKLALAGAHSDDLSAQLRRITFEYRNFLVEHGNTQRADAMQEQVRRLMPKLHNAEEQKKHQLYAYMRVGDNRVRAGDDKAASSAYYLAYEQAKQLQDPIAIGNCAMRIGGVSQRSGNMRSAEYWYRQALRFYDSAKTGSTVHRGAISGLAVVLATAGNKSEAEKFAKQLLSDSESISSSSANGAEMREAWAVLVCVYEASNQQVKAIDPQTRLYDSYRQHEPIANADCVMNMCYLANQYWMLGDRAKYRTLINEYVSLTASAKSAALLLPARLMDDYAEVVAKSGAKDEAEGFLRAAQKILANSPNKNTELSRNRQLLAECTSKSKN